MSRKHCLVAFVVFIMVISVASVGLAQTSDRGQIEGKVSDETGAVLPGVTVTLTSPALLTPQLLAVTGPVGRYRFTTLPPGTYALMADLAGFGQTKLEGLRLTTGFVARIDMVMSVAALAEAVTVVAESPVVDVRTTAVTPTFTREEMESVPTVRQIWQIMDLSPGVRVNGGFRSDTPDVGGNTAGLQQLYHAYGSSRGGNRPTLEGVDMHEQTERSPFYFDFSSYEEIQIKAMGNDAEVSASGLNLVVVVKSGGNTFHGGGLFDWEGPSLQSTNIDDEQRAKGVTQGNTLTEYSDFGLELGGRIVRDRAWFYGGTRRQRVGSTRVGFSESPGPDGIYGTPDDVVGEAKTIVNMYTGKLSFQLNPDHKLIGFYSRSHKANPYSGGSSFRPGENTVETNFVNNVAKGEWNWIPNENSFVNFFVGRNWWANDYVPYTQNDTTYDTVTRQWRGISVASSGLSPEPYAPSRQRTMFTGSFTRYVPNFLGGDHDFKLGGEVINEHYQTQTFARERGNDFQLRLQSGDPFEVILYNTPYSSKASMRTTSFYLKDSWRLGERLTVNAGFRFDHYDSFLPAQSKEAGRFSEAADLAKRDIVTWSGVVPRLGVAYALTSDARTVLKATYGRFNFLLSPDIGRPFNLNDFAQTVYKWSDPNGNGTYDDGEEGTFVSATSASNRVLNPNLKSPKVDEVTLTLEREVVANLGVRFSYIFKREDNLFQRVNLARPASVFNIPISAVDPGPDGTAGTSDDGGPITYYDYDPAVAGRAFEQIADQNTPGYSDKFNNYEVGVTKRLSDRWHMMASYLATKRDKWRGGVFSGRDGDLGVPLDPNAENFFPRDKTWEWKLAISGGYLLPYDVQLAGSFIQQSGGAWAREARFTAGLEQLSSLVLRMEPYGTRRREAVNLVTFRVEKRFQLGPGQAGFHFDVFNTLNTNAETGINDRSGSSFGGITAIVPPRVIRLGVKYDF